MDLKLERKLSANSWVISVRWIYVLSIFFLGWLTRVLGVINVNFSIFLMAFLAFFISLINISLHFILKKIKKNPKEPYLNLFGIGQIAIELFFYGIIFHYTGGVEGLGMLYFVIPIVFSPIILGRIGTFFTVMSSAAIVCTLFVFERIGIINHMCRYNFKHSEMENIESIIIKIVTFFIFYAIIGFLSAHNFKNLFKREDLLEEKSQTLNKDYEKREDELKQLDHTAKLLIRRDMMLMQTNKELDEKIEQLKSVEEIQRKSFEQLKEERAKVEEEEKKIKAIIFNLIDPIILLGRNGKISLFNPAAEEVLGLNKDHIKVKINEKNNFSMLNFKDIFKSKYKVKSAKELKIDDDNIEEIVFPQKDGFEITYKVITAKVIADDNRYFGTLKIFYNLTREKMIDRFKSEFISIAAHQMRTPLSAVKWAIKMVLDGDMGPLNKEQMQILNKGYQSNERIIDLVNDMLNVSRIEEGRYGYSFKQSRLEDVIDYVKESLENKIKDKKIKLIIKKPDKIPLIYMDREKILLVVQNILENATKYTPEYGTIYVFIEIMKDFLIVKIQDNGVGIPKKDQAKLFSKFFRATNVIRLQTEGSGLGLFIAKNVIEKHGGTIKCNSTENIGTEFIFTLPLNKKSKK